MGLKKAFTDEQRWAIYTIKEGLRPGFGSMTTKELAPFEELVDMKILRRGKDRYEPGERFEEHKNIRYFRDSV
jgi:hypothetical protein